MTFSPNKPIDQNNGDYNAVNCRYVVHIACQNGFSIWEAVHDEREECPHEKNAVGKETKGSEPEWAVFDVIAAFDQEAGDRDRVGNVKEHNTCRYHTIGVAVNNVLMHNLLGPAYLLNAVYDPRYKQPTAATIMQLTRCALTGTSNFGLTFASHLAPGRPPSRANDQQSRDCHV
jgi:hypothetical protein